MRDFARACTENTNITNLLDHVGHTFQNNQQANSKCFIIEIITIIFAMFIFLTFDQEI